MEKYDEAEKLVRDRLPVIGKSVASDGSAIAFRIAGTEHHFAFSGLDLIHATGDLPGYINSKIDRFISKNLNGSHVYGLH